MLSAGDRITAEDLPLGHIASSGGPSAPENPAGFHEAVVAYKRQIIRDALRRFGGNQSRAASALGLQRTYLSRLIKELEVRDKT